jgi:ribosomal protein S18 acetylase RimI-like enzyme
MDVRPCGAGDAASVVALWEACGLTRPWNDPHTDFNLAIATATSRVLAGFEGDALVASVMVGFDGHRGWVYYLAVDPTRQRFGHGRRMMDAAEAWLKARGAPKIQLMVRQDNAVAVAFYKRLGFEDQPVATLGKRLDGR